MKNLENKLTEKIVLGENNAVSQTTALHFEQLQPLYFLVSKHERHLESQIKLSPATPSAPPPPPHPFSVIFLFVFPPHTSPVPTPLPSFFIIPFS